ncbi:NAD(P)/FAD-dependent oxidoreductase [Arthrobacter sp. RHLT1-20]
MATYLADIAIIGGGIAGLSLAAAMAGPRRVVLVESEATLAHHTSGRSAQQMQPTYGPAPVRALTAASLQLIPEIERSVGRSLLSSRPLIWCGLDGEEVSLRELVSSNLGLREASVAEAVRRLPVLNEGALRSAAVDENAMEVDVPALLDHYTATARSNGTQILLSSPLTSASRWGHSWVLQAGPNRIFADTVVNASGAWADNVAALFGKSPQGLRPYRRTVTVAEPLGRSVDPNWPMCCDMGGTFYFRPQGRNILASPIEDIPCEPQDAAYSPADVARVKERINSLTDLALGPSLTSWTGLRTIAPDGLPVIGRDPEDPSFYWLAGQGGYGIQTSPALAELVAADLANERSRLDTAALEAFEHLSPARTAGLP